MAYTVSRRTHEIGIRMALGTERADVVRMVLRMALRVIGVGIALGLLASVGVAVVMVVGLVASYVPAWHATRVDPTVALRRE